MKTIIIVLIAIVVIVIVFFILMPKGPSIKDYEYLKSPQVTQMPSKKMMTAKAKGNPEITAGKALKLLFQTYFKIKGVSKTHLPAPLARWYVEPDSAPETWVGEFAIPIPNTLNELPQIENKTGLKVEITIWQYGEVAEILHVGSYDCEKPTFDKLDEFISKNGYEMAGPHEEEYVKGPSPYWPTNPKKYLTIIRCQVRKK
jgi:hypothetical protein